MIKETNQGNVELSSIIWGPARAKGGQINMKEN